MRFLPVVKAERALSLVPALIRHARGAAQTRSLEELYVQAGHFGANRAMHALRSKVLQAINRWQNDPLVRPSQEGPDLRVVRQRQVQGPGRRASVREPEDGLPRRPVHEQCPLTHGSGGAKCPILPLILLSETTKGGFEACPKCF